MQYSRWYLIRDHLHWPAATFLLMQPKVWLAWAANAYCNSWWASHQPTHPSPFPQRWLQSIVLSACICAWNCSDPMCRTLSWPDLQIIPFSWPVFKLECKLRSCKIQSNDHFTGTLFLQKSSKFHFGEQKETTTFPSHKHFWSELFYTGAREGRVGWCFSAHLHSSKRQDKRLEPSAPGFFWTLSYKCEDLCYHYLQVYQLNKRKSKGM